MKRLLIPAVLLLAACGGGGSSSTPTTVAATIPATTATSTTTTVAPSTTITPRPTFGKIVTDCAAKLWSPADKGYIPGREEFLALADATDTLSMTLAGPGGVSGNAFNCVLDAIGFKQFDRDRMGQTRALDGMQTAEWDGYRAAWTYHPDDGLRITIEDTEQTG